MREKIELLFCEVADLPAAARECYFAARQISAEIRAEIESLLAYDTMSLTAPGCIGDAVRQYASAGLFEGGRCGPYELVRLLGQGGMGTVFLGRRTDGEVEQRVAIKFVRPTSRLAFRERFLRERQILASLNHSGIARLFDAGHTEDGHPYLVMEYVEGIPLDDYCQKLDFKAQLELCLRLCDAISYAHRNLVVHRDLKPSNILVDENGQPKLLDFGIARILDDTADTSISQERILTPDYASPEQIRGTAHTTATDVYSLGAVMYRLLTGHAPHAPSAGSLEPIESRICSAQITQPSKVKAGLPKDLDFILGRAMRKDPDQRYASVDAMAEDIRALLDSRPVRARSGNIWYRTRKFARRHWPFLVAAALVIASLTAGLVVANRQRTLAERRFSQVLILASRVQDLDRAMAASVPGDLFARRELVSTSLEYLKSLSEAAPGDLELSREVARGYFRVGHIQGSPTAPNLGEPKQAEANLAIAEQWVQRVLAARPSYTSALALGVVIAEDRMYIARDDNRLADMERFLQLEEERIDAFSKSKEPKKPSDLRTIGVALHNMALQRMAAHRYAEAEALAAWGVEIASRSQFNENQLMLRMLQARSQLYQGNVDSARKLMEGIPPQPPTGDAFFSLNYLKAEILGMDRTIGQGRNAEAIAVFENVLAELQKHAQAVPKEAKVRDRIAVIAVELGNLLWRVNPARALQIYDAAFHALAELPETRARTEKRAEMLAGSARAMGKQGRFPAASQHLSEALRAAESARILPADKVTLDSSAFRILEAQAIAAGLAGDRKRAYSLYEAILQRVEAAKPDIRSNLVDVPMMSALYEALGFQDRRLELWQHWNQRLPGNSFVQRQLALAQTAHQTSAR